MLYSGHLDLVLIAKPYKTDNLNVQLIKKDYFHVAVPFQSALLKQPKKSLSNKDISGTNMLLLDEGHCLREHVLESCNKEAKQKIEDDKTHLQWYRKTNDLRLKNVVINLLQFQDVLNNKQKGKV